MKHKLSTLQLMLMSTGGMIGAGWLFSPYYGFQAAGAGVLLSWAIVLVLTFVIGIAFAEVVTLMPIVGGLSRYIGVTHNGAISFIFLTLGWLSYVVYLPLEVQSALQYFSFWWHDLVIQSESGTRLSSVGLVVAILIITFLTWFNALLLKNVARLNSLVSVWKILMPIGIAWVLIVMFGSFENIEFANNQQSFSFEKVLLAITGSGMAFAFTGFQNGLILANSAKNPARALPYSLFFPIVVGFILYGSLSLVYIACLGDKQMNIGSAAPLLGIVSLFGVHIIITLLFADAVIAPLGTANVYTAATSRILLGLAKEFFPHSFLVKLNKFHSPYKALWLNAAVGMCFLMPTPTWQQLVDFLSSIVVFSYIAGPVTLMVLRREFPEMKRPFKVWNYQLIGYLGFICCSLLVYWSSLSNLIYLSALSLLLIIVHNIFIDKNPAKIFSVITENFFVVAYLLALALVKYLHKISAIFFPIDNLLVIAFAAVACKVFIAKRISKSDITKNLQRVNSENSNQ
jgi:amino acid transporter